MKAFIGWLILLIGFGGLVLNAVYTFTTDASPVLLANSIFCILFILVGWRLAH